MPTPTNIDRIRAELQSLGYRTDMQDSPQGPAVIFDYKVELGRYKDKIFTLGISMQGHEPYPEYPPHWIHIYPPVNDDRGGSVSVYHDGNGREWVAMSRPPGPLWDELPTKNMDVYLREHLRGLWNYM